MATSFASMHVRIEGVSRAIEALQGLEKAVRVKHMRIALLAAGGVIKKKIEATAPKDTGLLMKSIRVKAIIPQASKNPAHHDKPASVFIGPGRGLVAVRTVRKSGTLGALSVRTFKSVKKKLDAAKAAGKSAPLKIITSGRSLLKQRIQLKQPPPIRASRYAHLVENDHKGGGTGTHFMRNAANSEASAAQAKFASKIAQGIKTEAARLASKP